MQARTDASDRDSTEFARRRGFAETMAMHQVTLMLTEARHAEHRTVLEVLVREGMEIVTLADVSGASPDARADYAELVMAAGDGWLDPDPDGPGDPPSVVDWAARVRGDDTDPARTLVARQHGQLIGFTGGLGTGVRPAWRNRGVATALKVVAIERALARGDTVMSTGSGNPAMRRVNEKLGFRETGCELRLVRRLR